MNNISKKIVLSALFTCACINAAYNDVAMPDPDIVETVSNVADAGVIDTSSVAIADRSPRGDNKKNKRRSLKAQARINARAKAQQEEEDEFAYEQLKERLIIKKPAVVKVEKNIDLPSDAYLVDSVEAIVYASEGTAIVVHSDVERPSLDGRPRTLEDMVYEKLMLLDAQKFRMVSDEEMIDKHLAAVQRDNNLTLDDLKNVFKAAGYSYEEGREQFGMISIINQILDFKIRSRLIVPEKEVIAYFNENPEVVDASYRIQMGTVEYTPNMTSEEQANVIEDYVNHDIGSIEIDWQEPFWIERNEMAEDKQFIIDLKPGKAQAVQTAQGFQVFRKIEDKPEHTRTLEERYREISDLLRRPKYEQLYNEYKAQLLAAGGVHYLND